MATIPLNTKPADGPQEIVLPSGRFARIGTVTMAEQLAAANLQGLVRVCAIACMVTAIDEEPLKIEELLKMSVKESNPIIEAVARQLVEGAQSLGVA